MRQYTTDGVRDMHSGGGFSGGHHSGGGSHHHHHHHLGNSRDTGSGASFFGGRRGHRRGLDHLAPSFSAAKAMALISLIAAIAIVTATMKG